MYLRLAPKCAKKKLARREKIIAAAEGRAEDHARIYYESVIAENSVLGGTPPTLAETVDYIRQEAGEQRDTPSKPSTQFYRLALHDLANQLDPEGNVYVDGKARRDGWTPKERAEIAARLTEEHRDRTMVGRVINALDRVHQGSEMREARVWGRGRGPELW